MRKSLSLKRATLAVAAVCAVAGGLAAASSAVARSADRALSGATVTTELSSSSTSVGGAGVHDSATLSGLTGSNFSGDTVSYAVYPSVSACTSDSGGTSEGSVTVSGNGALTASNTFTPTTPGTYYWQATFNGADKTNTAASSDCSTEPLFVDAVTTALSSPSAVVGGAGVHDSATLSGLAGSNFSGDTVSYAVYPSVSACTSDSGGTSEGSVTVSGNGALTASNTFTPTTPGTYYWQATFNGADKTNTAASSDCSSEPLTVTGTTTPTLATELSSSSTSVGGAGVHDSATLSGLTGSNFSGDTVSYAVYPSVSACTSDSGGTSEGSVTVSGNGALTASNTFTPTTPGTYYWQATFNGADKTNTAASSDCSSEPLTVYRSQPGSPQDHRGRLVCHRVRFGRGRHHHALWICFRSVPPRVLLQHESHGVSGARRHGGRR